MRSTTRTVTLAVTEAQGTALQLDSWRRKSGRLPGGNNGWPEPQRIRKRSCCRRRNLPGQARCYLMEASLNLANEECVPAATSQEWAFHVQTPMCAFLTLAKCVSRKVRLASTFYYSGLFFFFVIQLPRSHPTSKKITGQHRHRCCDVHCSDTTTSWQCEDKSERLGEGTRQGYCWDQRGTRYIWLQMTLAVGLSNMLRQQHFHVVKQPEQCQQ